MARYSKLEIGARGAALLVALLSLVSLLTPACIESKCLQHADCSANQVCQASTGACVAPECTAHTQCGQGEICEQFACVLGCLNSEDCADGWKCDQNRCRQTEEECQCSLAPDVCVPDINPTSPTYEQSPCIPSDDPGGTLLLFGSVLCSHCTDLLGAVREMEARLVRDGLRPRIVFVQVKDRPVTASIVGEALPDFHGPVVHDTDGLDIWEQYQVSWYYLAVIESHGCLSARFGPIQGDDVRGDGGPEIEEAWRASMASACPDALPVEQTDGGR